MKPVELTNKPCTVISWVNTLILAGDSLWKMYKGGKFLNPLTLKIQLPVLPSGCYTSLCRLVMRI